LLERHKQLQHSALQSDLFHDLLVSDYTYDKEFKLSFKRWFDDSRAKAYVKKTGYPWTRLGYTYDWGAEDKKYGLTEFLILQDSHVRVQFTKNVPTFVKWLEERN